MKEYRVGSTIIKYKEPVGKTPTVIVTLRTLGVEFQPPLAFIKLIDNWPRVTPEALIGLFDKYVEYINKRYNITIKRIPQSLVVIVSDETDLRTFHLGSITEKDEFTEKYIDILKEFIYYV